MIYCLLFLEQKGMKQSLRITAIILYIELYIEIFLHSLRMTKEKSWQTQSTKSLKNSGSGKLFCEQYPPEKFQKCCKPSKYGEKILWVGD